MQALAFVTICVIWGLTWLAMKLGIAVVPPLIFAGLRFVAAGTLLVAYCATRTPPLLPERRDWPRLAAITLLMVVLTYGLLFWGMLFVPSGLSAVLDLSIMPASLLVIGVILGEEQVDRRRLAAIATGTIGLLLLLGPKAAAAASGTLTELAGAAAILASTVAYAWGSILARPMLGRCHPAALAGITTLGGGLLLVAIALALEPGAVNALRGDWGLNAWLGWLFLVLAGSLLAYTLYLRLLRDWGPVRAGSYAFVSPIIAVLVGLVALDEHIGPLDIAGIAAMLAGAWLCTPTHAPSRENDNGPA